MSMTPQQLERAGITLFGHEWQSALARALEYNPRQIRRYYAGETPINRVVEYAVRWLLHQHRGT